MTSGLEGRKLRELGERRGIPPKTEGKFNSKVLINPSSVRAVSSIAIAFLCIPAVSFHWRNVFGPKSQGIRRKVREWWRNSQPPKNFIISQLTKLWFTREFHMEVSINLRQVNSLQWSWDASVIGSNHLVIIVREKRRDTSLADGGCVLAA